MAWRNDDDEKRNAVVDPAVCLCRRTARREAALDRRSLSTLAEVVSTLSVSAEILCRNESLRFDRVAMRTSLARMSPCSDVRRLSSRRVSSVFVEICRFVFLILLSVA